MKKLIFSLLLLPVLLVLLFLATQMRWKWSKPVGQKVVAPELVGSNVVAVVSAGAAAIPAGHPQPLLGETILRDYGNSNLPPENDLKLLAHLLDNSLLLLKSAANRPLSANEDWADLLRGKNAAHEEFLPAHHVVLNEQGQLVDRWGTPLFFHALGGGRVEIRSAGPDKKLWTDDDLHRQPNGSFLRGTNLNPASLLPASARQ